MKYAIVRIEIKPARVGVYRSMLEIIDAMTDEIIINIEREHTKRPREGVAITVFNEAIEICREQGYLHIEELQTKEPNLIEEFERMNKDDI